MFFQITNLWQILGWFLVFAGLIIMNELGRRTKVGGMIIFVIIPCILTVYFVHSNLYLLILFTYFIPLPTAFPSGKH